MGDKSIADKEFVQVIRDISAIKANTANSNKLLSKHIDAFEQHMKADQIEFREINAKLKQVEEAQSKVKYMIVGAVSVVTFLGYAAKWSVGFLIK